MTNKEKEQEIWKSYPDYPFIEANQFGEVIIKDRVTTRKNGVKYHVKGRVLKQHFYPNGYMYVLARHSSLPFSPPLPKSRH